MTQLDGDGLSHHADDLGTANDFDLDEDAQRGGQEKKEGGGCTDDS